MPTLHLGVIDLPYSLPAGSTRPGRRKRVVISAETTGAWID